MTTLELIVRLLVAVPYALTLTTLVVLAGRAKNAQYRATLVAFAASAAAIVYTQLNLIQVPPTSRTYVMLAASAVCVWFLTHVWRKPS